MINLKHSIPALALASAFFLASLAEPAFAQNAATKPATDVLPAAATTSTAVSVTLPPLAWNGDFRYRHEWLGTEGSATRSTHQHRIRARLGAKASLPSNTSVELRLATSTGRTSTNQTLGGSGSAFANYTFTLDRAAFRWNPVSDAYVVGGRFGTPFFAPGESDLIWDSDLNFDGLALGGALPAGPLSLFANGGFFWIDKSTTAGRPDVTLGSGQLGVKHKVSDTLHWAVAGAMHYYGGILRHTGLVTSTDTNGNSSAASGANAIYIRDYNVLDLGAELGAKIAGIPVVFLGQWVKNMAVDDQLDRGWLAGVKVGKLKEGGDWSLGYDYRKLEKDAVLGAFTDGDVFGGGADGRGHRFSANYQVAKHWTLGASYYDGETRLTGRTALDRDRFHADLLFKF